MPYRDERYDDVTVVFAAAPPWHKVRIGEKDGAVVDDRRVPTTDDPDTARTRALNGRSSRTYRRSTRT